MKPHKKNCYFPLYRLFNTDPYNGLLQSSYILYIPIYHYTLYTHPNNQEPFFIAQVTRNKTCQVVKQLRSRWFTAFRWVCFSFPDRKKICLDKMKGQLVGGWTNPKPKNMSQNRNLFQIGDLRGDFDWYFSNRGETKIFETTTQVNIVNGGGPSQPQTFCIHWRCELPSPTYLLLMSSSFNKEHGHSLLIASSLAIVAYCGHSCLSCILARYVTRLVSTDFSWRQLLDWNGCKNYMHN